MTAWLQTRPAATVFFSAKRPGVRGGWHIYEIGVDGEGLRQITSGHSNNISPLLLPGGEIMFVSDRIPFYLVCQSPSAGALFVARRDGRGVRRVSDDVYEGLHAAGRAGRLDPLHGSRPARRIVQRARRPRPRGPEDGLHHAGDAGRTAELRGLPQLRPVAGGRDAPTADSTSRATTPGISTCRTTCSSTGDSSITCP